MEFFYRSDHFIYVGVLCRAFGRVRKERYSRFNPGDCLRAFGGRLGDIRKLFGRGVLVKTGVGVYIATVFAILISAFGSNHQKVRRNDRSTFCGFDNLQTGAKSIRRGMARAGNHTVYVARFKHKRAEHGIIFFNRFVSEFFRHALFFAEFVKKVGVSLGFFIRKRIDYRNAGQIHVGVIGFDFGFVAEQHYFGDSFFYGIGSGFYDTFVFAFGKNYRLTERGGSFFDFV